MPYVTHTQVKANPVGGEEVRNDYAVRGVSPVSQAPAEIPTDLSEIQIRIYNDPRQDGDNLAVLDLTDLPPGQSLGFTQSLYDVQENIDFQTGQTLEEIPLAENGSGDIPPRYSFPFLSASSTIKTAILLIRDNENPNRSTTGTEGDDPLRFLNDDRKDTIFARAGNDTVESGNGDDFTFGEAGNDILRSGEGDDFLFGGEGDDQLFGGNGKDWLDGGSGRNVLEGGFGDDTYVINSYSDSINDAPQTGIETVRSFVSWSLQAGLDHLVLLGDARDGWGNNLNNIITGNVLNNTLSGDQGDDVLNGGLGADTLLGGFGNDILDGGLDADVLEGGFGDDLYIIDNVGDRIIEQRQTGIETVQSSISFDLSTVEGLDNLILTNANFDGSNDALNNINGFGNDLNNTLTGNSGNNILRGASGDDVFIVSYERPGTGYGEDSFYGELGADRFRFNSDAIVGGDRRFSPSTATIQDFNAAEGDKIEIASSAFRSPSLSQFSFVVGSGGGTLFFSDTVGGTPQQLAVIQASQGFNVSRDIRFI